MIQIPPIPESLKPFENELKEFKVSFERNVIAAQNLHQKVIDLNLPRQTTLDLSQYILDLIKNK